jgi:uncharacterized membrane protein YcgQ (UPF0703/DUF1980 family)
LLEKRPFSKNSIKEHAHKGGVQSPVVKSRMIASPMLNSKFSPSSTIGRSPVITKKSIFSQNENKKTVSPFITQLSDLTLNPDEDKKVDDKNKVNVNRKARNMFKNIESIESKPKFFNKNNDEDLPVTSCINTTKKDEMYNNY